MKTIISIISLVHAYVRGQILRHSAQQVVPRLVRDGKALGVVIAIHQPGDLDVRYAIQTVPKNLPGRFFLSIHTERNER